MFPKAPYIPPIDSSNLRDTQNFEEAFLKMKPAIDDEIYVDMEQEEGRGQVDSEPTGSDDPIATPFQPRISLAYPPDDTVHVFDEYSFNDRHSNAISEEEGEPRNDNEEGEDRETEAETLPRRNDLSEQRNLILEALKSLSPPIQQRPAESPPVYADASPALFPNNTDLTTQISTPPPILPTDVLANAAATAALPYHHHQDFKHQSIHPQRNTKHTRQEKTAVSISEPDDRFSVNDENDDVHATQGGGFDNRPENFVNVDRGNHSGPHSIKTVSYHLLSLLAPESQADETTIRCQNVHFRPRRARPA